MVGVPHSPQSFRKWLIEYQPDRFDQLRYSDEDRLSIIESLKKAVRLKNTETPPTEEFYPLLHQIEDIAAQYVALEKAFRSDEGLPPRSDQRKQLNRPASATKSITFRKSDADGSPDPCHRTGRRTPWHQGKYEPLYMAF